MAFSDGFYRVSFGTPLGSGYGVAYLAGGKLRGGDSMMAYVGTYQVDGDTLRADVKAFKHSTVPGMTSVFGVDNAVIAITGTITGNTVKGTGKSPQAPGVTLQVQLQPLTE